YRPTPIVAPWNGGSGFYPKDNRTAIDAIAGSTAPRLASYRNAIAASKSALATLGITEKVGAEQKRDLLEVCRAQLADDALPWLDAAFVLTGQAAKYPPLLGTGGNDGRLDFTNNFMQRLLDVIEAITGAPTPGAKALLRASLLDETTDLLTSAAIGQFLPAGAGGANAGVGFDGESRFNAWDFVLMLEGAATFAAATVRRMGTDAEGALSFPFTVRATGVGYASAADADEGASRGELWLPLWKRPATYAEIATLFAEGRARLGRRSARNGVDFARAVATLGVDRGISGFARYGLQVRNGLAYLATPLDRVRVHEVPQARMLDEIDTWLNLYRRRATSDRAPASARRALRGLERAIVEICRRGSPERMQAVLIALGECERAMARSLRWSTDPKTRLTPVPPLSAERWLQAADDGSAELRLAAALASSSLAHDREQLPLRGYLEPVRVRVHRGRSRIEWSPTADRDVVWMDGDVIAALNAVLQRHLMTCVQLGLGSDARRAGQTASLADVAAFIEARIDDERFAALLWGCILLDWPRSTTAPLRADAQGSAPSALFGLLKTCLDGRASSDELVPLEPRIFRIAGTGDGAEASRAAVASPRASGRVPALTALHERGESVRRTAAATLFPLDTRSMKTVEHNVLRHESGEMTP
ncbi:MAG: type I-U CRISPR-associated protein Csx17, partial [Sandaracinaceae bacterium]|nr:type I-U CRISPR-associated protein Csx17 [Sandaracinaceae bacterium]